MTHGVVVHQIQHSRLAAHEQIMDSWNQYCASRSQIPVLIVQIAPFARSVPVEQRKISAGKMKQRFAEVGDTVPVAIARDGNHVSFAIHRGSASSLPKGCLTPVRSAVENGLLL